MDSIRQTLGTIDKFQLINSNYIKDKISRNNNQERIINHMKKLGYLNFNMIEESRKFLLNLLSTYTTQYNRCFKGTKEICLISP